MLPVKTILHPTDFSAQAENAYNLACALAREYKARLLLVHVKVIPTAIYGEFGAIPIEPEDLQDSLKSQLMAKKPRLEAGRVEYYLVAGDPAGEIINLARDKKADLIVMGTHGRTGLGRLMMGSVAEEVVRKALCPVLTIKTPLAVPAKVEKRTEQSVPVG